MKKNILMMALVLFVASTLGGVLAQAETSIQAGVAAAVKGEARATTPPDKTARVLKSGDKVFMGDKIETGTDGQLQILLLDQTVFTLGPSSAITVDEFVYDPNNAGDKAGMVKGVLRAVAGKVTNKKPDNVAETGALLNDLDELDQKSQEASQDRAQSSAGTRR